MNRRLFALATLTAVMLGLTTIGQVMAAVGPRQSDNNLRWARYRVEENLDMLQRDRHDYNGYRVRAIADMQAARTQILLGLGYDRNHDWAAARPLAAAASAVGVDNRSDRNLLIVRRNVEHIIDVLQRDNHDYGGHRVAAIAALQRARQDIIVALRYDSRH